MLCVLYAIFTAISRITDHKHHPTDVMAGAALGAVLATATVHRILVADTDLPVPQPSPRHSLNNNSSSSKRLGHVDVEEDQLIEDCPRNGDAADGHILKKVVFQSVANV